MRTEGLVIHAAVVHSVSADSGHTLVQVPALSGVGSLSVPPTGLPVDAVGGYVTPNPGDRLYVAVTPDLTEVSWVTSPDSAPSLASPGDIKQSIRDTPESGWLMLDGSAIVDAPTKFPGLWEVAPVSWKSGSTLTLPDMSERILQGGAITGESVGSNDRAIAEGNLPNHNHGLFAHRHDIDHGHSDSFAIGSHNHRHTINHNHPSANTSTDTHNHGRSLSGFLQRLVSAQSGSGIFRMLFDQNEVTGVMYVDASSPKSFGSDNDSHNHSFNVPSYSGNSGYSSHSHTLFGNVTVHSGQSDLGGEGATASTGSGVPLSVKQASLYVNYFIKT